MFFLFLTILFVYLIVPIVPANAFALDESQVAPPYYGQNYGKPSLGKAETGKIERSASGLSSQDLGNRFVMTNDSYSFAQGTATRLGIDFLQKKQAADLSGRFQGRTEEFLVPGKNFPTTTGPNSNIGGFGTQYNLNSIGVLYRLTKKLTLDGSYAVIKKGNRSGSSFGVEERRMPSIGANYTLNTTTSISVNYRHLNTKVPNSKKDGNEHEASAELRINF